MDIGSIFLILGLLILVGLFISRPFCERKATVVSGQEHEFSALMAERDRVLNALQELDFDHSLEKIPEADYPVQRATLLQSGAEILRRLDALLSEASSGDLEARMEAAIAARSQASSVETGRRNLRAIYGPDDDLEALLANRRRSRIEKSAGFCPQCGSPVQQSDRFCPKCGASLQAEEKIKA